MDVRNSEMKNHATPLRPMCTIRLATRMHMITYIAATSASTIQYVLP